MLCTVAPSLIPSQAFNVIPEPRWPPNGKQIAFAGSEPGGKYPRIYLISSDGGTPEPVTPEGGNDPDWSRDGTLLLFSNYKQVGTLDMWSICRLDLDTHQVTALPGSASVPCWVVTCNGARGPANSPNGKYVAAIGADGGRLVLFDVQSQRWTTLAEANSSYSPLLFWSRDSRYVYAQDLTEPEQPILRARIGDHKVEIIATLRQFVRSDAKSYLLARLTPDGSLSHHSCAARTRYTPST